MSGIAKRTRSRDSSGTSSSSKRQNAGGPEGGPSQPPEKMPDESNVESIETHYIKCIQQAIVQIYHADVSSLHFSSLYSAGHHLIQAGHGMQLYRGIEAILKALLHNWFTKKLLPCADEVFLEQLKKMWDDHFVAISLTAKLAMQLDKSDKWASPASTQRAGRSSAGTPSTSGGASEEVKVMTVTDLGVHLFGKILLERAVERCRKLMLSVVHTERIGEAAPHRTMLKGLTDMMVTIGLENVYVPCLEAGYLQEAEEYFTIEAAHFFQNNTVVDYLRKALKRMDEEEARIQSCLHESTGPKLKEILDRVLIKDYDKKLIEKENTGVHSMLVDWRLNDIQIVYTAFRRVSHLQPIVDEVANFCKDEGLKIVGEQQVQSTPVQIIDQLIAQRNKFTELIRTCFTHTVDNKQVQEAIFITAVHIAFKDIIKANKRLPEYMSLYIDNKFQNAKSRDLLSDEDAEKMCDEVLTLFDYLQDKDIFEKFYKQHLAKRLLQNKSSAADHERLFLSKLKAAHGHAFTNHLEGMFNDIKQAEDVMGNYREALRAQGRKHDVDLYVSVLTQGHWPLTQSPNVRLPPEMQAPMQDFTIHYEQRFTNGRRLSFCYQLGHADLRLTTKDRKYELNVTTHQALVLLLFNDATELTMRDLQERIGTEWRELKRALMPLCCGKPKAYSPILKRVKQINPESGATESKELSPDTRFQFNADFASKMTKIKILPMPPKDSTEETRETTLRLEDERKHITECAIVRIMKSRRQLGHQELITELIKQLSNRFNAQPSFLKHRIEDLISREYLRRDPEQRTVYQYMA